MTRATHPTRRQLIATAAALALPLPALAAASASAPPAVRIVDGWVLTARDCAALGLSAGRADPDRDAG